MQNKFSSSIDVYQGWLCVVATANTSRTGASGTFVKAFDAGKNGSRVDTISVEPQAAIAAATVVRLFASPDAGTTKYPRKELAIAPLTLAAGDTPIPSQDFALSYPIILPSGWSLWASVHTSDTLNLHLNGGDY